MTNDDLDWVTVGAQDTQEKQLQHLLVLGNQGGFWRGGSIWAETLKRGRVGQVDNLGGMHRCNKEQGIVKQLFCSLCI